MSAFLSKPIAMEQLHAMLKKHLPDQPTEMVEDPAPEHDVEALRKLDGYESDGRPLVAVLFDEFRDNARLDVDKMAAAQAAGKWTDLRYLAHSLKSSGRTLGLNRFGDLCEQIEREADGSKNLEAEVAEIRALFDRGCGWLDQQLAAGDQVTPT